ncbi:MAG: hypothetical protein QXU99_00015 [Candidatus Bathyarchaeia archaeon]
MSNYYLRKPPFWRRKIRATCLLALLFSTVGIGVIAGFNSQSERIPLEIVEPIEILDCPSVFTLFPGETKEFTVTVQNMASVAYSLSLNFSLNDTEYQARYVSFSSENYTVNPGKQTLTAWLAVSADAPSGNFLLNITFTRNNLTEAEPEPSPMPHSQLAPTLLLLGSGARWAANPKGDSVLFVNWHDNCARHHLTDGADWGPWGTEENMENSRLLIAQTLEQFGFSVHFAGDIPQDLSAYGLVLIEAYFAVEPCHSELIRDYVRNGGGVVLLSGVPCYFSVYCKDYWPYRFGGMDLTSLQDWFGCRFYVNAGGTAKITFDNPFGTTLSANTTVFTTQSYSAAAVSAPMEGTQIVASWSDGAIFAFTHEYGQGRVYYQAGF